MPPAPKHPSMRARTNKVAGARTLHAAHDLTAPPLPVRRDWQVETRQWWEAIWASPMAPEFDSSDLGGLYKLAVLEDDFWSAESSRERAALAAEIRLQRQCFGLSPIDRRRLQWEVDRGEAADEQTSRRRQARKPKAAEDPRQLLAQ